MIFLKSVDVIGFWITNYLDKYLTISIKYFAVYGAFGYIRASQNN